MYPNIDFAALGPEALTGGARNDADEASVSGVGGLVFSVLFSLVVIAAIVFLCWAQKAKVSMGCVISAGQGRIHATYCPSHILLLAIPVLGT